MGEMADLEVDWGYFGDDFDLATCKYCGEQNLEWGEMPDGRKRLFDLFGNLHWCIEYSGGDSGKKKDNEEDFDIGWDDNE